MSENIPILADYLTEAEVLRELKLKNARTLRRWRNDGKGPPLTKIGRQKRYYRPSFVAWVAAQEQA